MGTQLCKQNDCRFITTNCANKVIVVLLRHDYIFRSHSLYICVCVCVCMRVFVAVKDSAPSCVSDPRYLLC